ncbi:MAG: DUF211 domain-containing protein [Sphingomonadaceae bacterium]|nr:DUF211 domain-containing protein [Sphingomonadaceae bacterium]
MSRRVALNIRRVVLDVDKALKVPALNEIAAAIHATTGVEAFNITVTEVDQETIGTSITVEGEDIDYNALVSAIEGSGAVVHSLDQIACGKRIVEYVPRAR